MLPHVAEREARLKHVHRILFTAVAALVLVRPVSAASRVEVAILESQSLKGTKTGLDPVRSVYVYLPPGYDESRHRYPVVYFFHSIFWSPQQMFADGRTQAHLDRAIAKGVTKPFILVAADFSSPLAGSLYENSAITGRWLDFTMQELVPFVDGRFRTLAEREARGLAGEFLGGRGAFVLAMRHPETFSSVYAMHLVATGIGLVPELTRADWPRIHKARSYEDLEGDRLSQIYLAMSQAFLPNPDRPPFYCDFMVEMEDGIPVMKVENARKIRAAFLLDRLLPEYAGNLRKMRAIMFDWSRYDETQGHVYANQAFTRKLDEWGVPHAAEEYGGATWWKMNFTDGGRFEAEVLPFFGQHLKFLPTVPTSR